MNIVYNFYNPSQEILDIHLSIWSKIPIEYRRMLNIILIDDCSNIPLLINPNFAVNLTIAKIEDDILWNTSGSRNLGIMLANNDWIFCSDIDHYMDANDYIKMINYKKSIHNIYFFKRILPNGQSRNKNVGNIFIAHREDLLDSSLYDEDFAGRYGWDETLLIGKIREPLKGQQALLLKNNITYNQTDLIIVENSKFASGSSDTYLSSRNSNHNLKMLEIKQKEVQNNTYKNGQILRFRWKIDRRYKI